MSDEPIIYYTFGHNTILSIYNVTAGSGEFVIVTLYLTLRERVLLIIYLLDYFIQPNDVYFGEVHFL